jgi:hypothetical protein
MTVISERELMGLIVEADDAALADGIEPRGRPIAVIANVMKRLGYDGYILAGAGTPEIVEKIQALHRSLYRPSDLGVGGIHGGIFMFRDVFARINVPMMFGTVQVDPLKYTDLEPKQLAWLRTRPADFHAFIDQFIDIFDFAGGIGNFGDFKTPPKVALEIFWLAAFQLQAAAAALSMAFDFRGAVQSSLIGAELALKGGLAALGYSEADRKRCGHDLETIAFKLSEARPQFDLERVKAVITRLPHYVENRYAAVQPGRIETGHIAMGAQYIAGEVIRHVTDFSIRNILGPTISRTYPSLNTKAGES